MNAEDAVERFRSLGKEHSTATRMVGYACLIQRDDSDGVAKYAPNGIAGLRSGFAEAGVDPLEIDFTEGEGLYLEELVRSSAHSGAAQRAQELLGLEAAQSTKSRSERTVVITATEPSKLPRT